MTFADPIGDMITRIRNAQMRLLSSVKIPSSKGIIIHSQLVEFPVDKSIKKHRN